MTSATQPDDQVRVVVIIGSGPADTPPPSTPSRPTRSPASPASFTTPRGGPHGSSSDRQVTAWW
ncbi:hypothetical protein SSRG_01402 [Streptomyces griseoflavus Tu4000]|uniref:Uncharacterized protein n=1 Tax=Streptomyces griseoflavus Tu4000 TaxID=467200 RepID=D9XPM4_9ACTN|nr:hypothetical protein SSRG_01402 [Streptomyces griseoflavus Tu4000]